MISLTEPKLEIIIESLEWAYERKLRRAQRIAGPRPHKIEEELRDHQIVLQEMMAYAKSEMQSVDNTGSAILH